MTYYRRPAPWLYSGEKPPKLEPPPKYDPPIDEARLLKEYAAWLRAQRKKRPEIEQALIAVRGGHNNPDKHPYAVAARNLPKVNAWLKERGYKPVLVKALAARIAHS
jgi:hypothetical protein